MPLSSTVTLPWSIISCAFTLSSGVTSARDSNPLSAFPATTPNAAANTLPTSLLFGIPQVNAFLYIPLFIATLTFLISPFVKLLAFATANAIAPGSVTPNAGFISSLIICDNSCIVKPSLFTCFLFSVSITYSFPLLLQKHILRSLLRKRVPILSSIQQALQSK